MPNDKQTITDIGSRKEIKSPFLIEKAQCSVKHGEHRMFQNLHGTGT